MYLETLLNEFLFWYNDFGGKMETYIKGNYRKSIFESEKGYVIGLFKVRETNDEKLKDYINRTITFTGYFYDLNEDDTFIFYGEGVEHPRYGFQFNVSNYEKVKPTDKDGIVEFLSSDLFPGIGEKLAISIVDTLGDGALDKILKEPECLNLVPRLTKKKADKIIQILKKYEESHQTIVYLSELGFNMREALSIYNKYGAFTMKTVDKNVFSIAFDLEEISFNKIDEASRRLEIEEFDDRRLEAIVFYSMKRVTNQNGDCYLDLNMIIRSVKGLFNITLDDDKLRDILKKLENADKIYIDGEDYYLRDIWLAEDFIVNCVYNMASKNNKKIDVLSLLNEMEKLYGISYNDKQKEAVSRAINSNFLVITGGPGTGKTTIIKAIAEIYQNINKLDYDSLTEDLILLAPTGRASKRMSESTGLPAYTIHRFLKWNKDSSEFMINENNKSNAKMVIVDEASMIDVNLFYSLLKGLKSNVKMVLVGDYNQLPSVGPGNILKDFIISDCVPIVYLNLLYRQDENSYINTLALEIKDGEVSDSFLNTYSDYTFLKCSSQYIKKNLKKLCAQVLEKGYDYKRVQLLAPMYKGENGIDLLNKELQDVFNPPSSSKREIKYGEVIYREGDKILQLVNMPDENIYNGDIGVIKYIKYGSTSKSGKSEIYVDFDGNIVRFSPKDYSAIKHGFIISIHKSQGSEFEVVIMPVDGAYKRMLYKKLIYTGITRAKRKLIIIGEPDAFLKSIYNNSEYIRKTKLLDKIRYKFEITG